MHQQSWKSMDDLVPYLQQQTQNIEELFPDLLAVDSQSVIQICNTRNIENIVLILVSRFGILMTYIVPDLDQTRNTEDLLPDVDQQSRNIEDLVLDLDPQTWNIEDLVSDLDQQTRNIEDLVSDLNQYFGKG